MNIYLVKNKVIGEKFEKLEGEFEQIKSSYESLLLEYTKNEKENSNLKGAKVELEMTYKQI